MNLKSSVILESRSKEKIIADYREMYRGVLKLNGDRKEEALRSLKETRELGTILKINLFFDNLFDAPKESNDVEPYAEIEKLCEEFPILEESFESHSLEDLEGHLKKLVEATDEILSRA